MKNIYQVGPDKSLRGGISTVIREISFSEKINSIYSLKFISTISEKSIITFFRSLLKVIRIEDKSIVHFHVASNGSFIRKYLIYKLLKKNTKKIFHLHGGGFLNFYRNSNKILKYFIRDMLNGCEIIINVSDYMMKELNKEFPFIKDKAVRIYNGIDLNIDEKPFKEKENSILFLGKLVGYKGIYDLINVIDNIKGFLIEKKWNVVIAGDGEVDKVNEILKQKNLLSVVKVIGWVDGDAKKEVLSKSKIAIIPSHVESFGIAAIEAMAYGNSIVCSNVGALPEIIKNEVNGFVVEKGNINGFEEKITSLIQNEEKMKAIYNNNIKYCKIFSIDNMMDNFIKQYRSIDGEKYEK
ncbi:glycosyltransferase family 4 protein [Clostridium septicum]|uniref:glycosyltransferase family 4 protein n=1 Tax=Clostridium septicum TaxID=1504 RepID=UPI00082A955D|nr:glycosyltransferase family 4 protein [Clostridium septicum]WLF68998.1 glycosyltransferase family 4 protein [Clostridium septicum]